MKNIGIYINPIKDKQGVILEQVYQKISKSFNESKVHVIKSSYGLFKLPDKLDILIVFGGDGTILGVARDILTGIDVPIFGVNIGNLGFLTGVEINELDFALQKIKNNKFKITKRLMLECNIFNGIEEYQNVALNDIVISRGTLSRSARFNIYIDNEYYDEFKGDGIIISTPTGSTAYSFSAGGPLIHPTLNNILISPICSHSPNMRSIVLGSESNIEIKSDSSIEELYVTVDGQKSIKLFNTFSLNAKKAKTNVRLIELDGFNYYNVLRKKILNKNY